MKPDKTVKSKRSKACKYQSLMYSSIGFEQYKSQILYHKNHKYFMKIKTENLSLTHPGN